MPTDVPLMSEDSILCWEIEATRGSAPAGATWRAFGKVTDGFTDLGPQNAVFRDVNAGSGREANSIGFEGQTLQGVIGPFQVVDPLVLGFAWGEETARAQIGATAFYRHTISPTTEGQLPSMSVHMRDRTQYTTAAATDKNTFLETIVSRLSLRGEEVREDGSGGRLMAALECMAHNDAPGTADKAVTLPTADPYRFHHGNITLWGEQLYRIVDWELTMDNQAKYSYFWQDSNSYLPYESPPESPLYDFTATIVADAEQFTQGTFTAKTIKEIARERLTGTTGTILMRRTQDEDEFQINLTDIVLKAAPKERRQGRVLYRVEGHVRATTFQYVDGNNSAFFPT